MNNIGKLDTVLDRRRSLYDAAHKNLRSLESLLIRYDYKEEFSFFIKKRRVITTPSLKLLAKRNDDLKNGNFFFEESWYLSWNNFEYLMFEMGLEGYFDIKMPSLEESKKKCLILNSHTNAVLGNNSENIYLNGYCDKIDDLNINTAMEIDKYLNGFVEGLITDIEEELESAFNEIKKTNEKKIVSS